MPDTVPEIWRARGGRPNDEMSAPSMWTALVRGVRCACPACGRGRIFAGWLRVVPHCRCCAAPLGRIRADDAPPYFTVFIVAHVIIGAQVAFERVSMLSVGTELLIFLPATLALVLLLIRPVKGATVGLMMKLGFMKDTDQPGDA